MTNQKSVWKITLIKTGNTVMTILAALPSSALLCGLVMLCWNKTITKLFSLPKMSFLDAFLMVLLVGTLGAMTEIMRKANATKSGGCGERRSNT